MMINGIAQNYYQLGRAAQFLGLGDLFGPADELVRSGSVGDELIAGLENAVCDVPEFETKRFSSIFDFRFYRIFLYSLVRALKPNLAIETGVLHGLTSAFFLEAMERNGHGRLLSVDLPSYPQTGPANRDGVHAVLPAGRPPGWAVPGHLRPRWDLRLGSSVDVLGGLTDADGGIDLFCHDSDHTYATMWWELTWAWDRLVPGGVLVCDNIDFSQAFFDFAARVGKPFIAFPAPDSRYSERVRFAVLLKS